MAAQRTAGRARAVRRHRAGRWAVQVISESCSGLLFKTPPEVRPTRVLRACAHASAPRSSPGHSARSTLGPVLRRPALEAGIYLPSRLIDPVS